VIERPRQGAKNYFVVALTGDRSCLPNWLLDKKPTKGIGIEVRARFEGLEVYWQLPLPNAADLSPLMVHRALRSLSIHEPGLTLDLAAFPALESLAFLFSVAAQARGVHSNDLSRSDFSDAAKLKAVAPALPRERHPAHRPHRAAKVHGVVDTVAQESEDRLKRLHHLVSRRSSRKMAQVELCDEVGIVRRSRLTMQRTRERAAHVIAHGHSLERARNDEG